MFLELNFRKIRQFPPSTLTLKRQTCLNLGIIEQNLTPKSCWGSTETASITIFQCLQQRVHERLIAVLSRAMIFTDI